MIVTRGFTGKRRSDGVAKERVPPGQFVTPEFPVLTAGPTPRTPLDSWTLALQHDGRLLAKWTWAEFGALPQTEIRTDIHCVTKWTKLDTRWRGVTFDDLLKAAGLAAAPTPFVIAHCDGGYTTNVPVDDLMGGKAMVATHFDGLALVAGARRAGAAAGAASLFLEEREVGASHRVHRSRIQPAFGSRWATTSTATHGASSVTRAIREYRGFARIAVALATVAAFRSETPRVKTIAFDVPGWPGHLAGQHLDIRLTAEDGYQAQRSYSIASPQGSDRGSRSPSRTWRTARCPRFSWTCSAGRRDRAARADRRLFHLEAGRSRPADAHRRRLGGCAADGDLAHARRGRRQHARAPALFVANRRRHPLSRRARRQASAGDGWRSSTR